MLALALGVALAGSERPLLPALEAPLPDPRRQITLRFDPVELAAREEDFARSNRWALTTLPLGLTGAGLTFLGALMGTWNPEGAFVAAMGVGTMVVAPIAGSAGALAASQQLRRSGVRVDRTPGGLAVAFTVMSLFVIPAPVTWPLAVSFATAQGQMNRQAFLHAMGRRPQVATYLVPFREGEVRGLALAGRW